MIRVTYSDSLTRAMGLVDRTVDRTIYMGRNRTTGGIARHPMGLSSQRALGWTTRRSLRFAYYPTGRTPTYMGNNPSNTCELTRDHLVDNTWCMFEYIY